MKQELAGLLKEVEDMSINGLRVSKTLLESGEPVMNLELINKKVMPDRMDSPPRAHVFHDAAGFTSYLETNKTEDLVVLIDTRSRMAAAVLDDKAKKGFEVVTFRPPYHPKFELLQATILQDCSIKQFAEGVMLCRELVAGVDGDEQYAGKQLALLMKQITVSNKVTMEHGTGVQCTNGVMVETKLRAGGQSEEPIEMPETIIIRTPIYLNTEPKTFELFLTAVPKGTDEVRIRTAAPELPVIEHELFTDMLVDVTNIEGAIVTYGTVGTGSWKYNQ